MYDFYSVNTQTIVGNVTKDAELRTTTSGKSVLNFSVATSKSYKDVNGEYKQKTSFHNVVCWGDNLERLCSQITKGRKIYVEGSPDVETYTKDGVEKSVIKITAQQSSIIPLSKKEATGQDPAQEHPSMDGPEPARDAGQYANSSQKNDDLPF